ncbi:MAG: MBL fold metallo-hydrolase [Deltaproteobacteria bacterium]|nr:MBL fold metallo-hydrolase [Deltaproteobacteria bacterium]
MEKYGKYDRPVRCGDGVFWVGFRDENTNLFCNPYLIIEDEQAVLIDGGSRTDFAVVMMKILQAGIDPRQIIALIYQHYDPDLCGSMPSFIDMCGNRGLKVLSDRTNNLFISYYIHRKKSHLLHSIDEENYQFTFKNRTLTFMPTPYAHSQGSFVTYDEKTKTLFTSDLFGSYSTQWDLFLELEAACFTCNDYDNCPNRKTYCPFPDMIDFHKSVMPCEKALSYAMAKIRELDADTIAPQHGSILTKKRDIRFISETLESLKGIGIDGISQS